MGTCLSHCFNIKNTKPYRSQRTMYSQGDDNVEQSPSEGFRSSRGISYLFSLRRKKTPQEVTLDLTDDTWPRRDENSQTVAMKHQLSGPAVVDVPLQPLDARSLLAARAVLQTTNQREKSIASSTPPSSLDLEWEHEGCLPIQPLHYAGVTEDDGCESAATNGQNGVSAAGSTAWSRVSTPDSLEWDPAEAPLTAASERSVEELDAETEQLLSEIERLTSRALRETGDWSS
ncbi:uncharacterized protein LOC110830384 isoform X2 [Zootermopsis nevadensis]|uniref:uncharacterized protein LOC110830384 isoform X2 n=1 Tax=Zootermopsis nevadensis TaxID=136037 RepID=UPI000B8EC2A3|nr:uncharacterized protein LOC110830384 isoform X2 [Zootermopsis nevadensis]